MLGHSGKSASQEVRHRHSSTYAPSSIFLLLSISFQTHRDNNTYSILRIARQNGSEGSYFRSTNQCQGGCAFTCSAPLLRILLKLAILPPASQTVLTQYHVKLHSNRLKKEAVRAESTFKSEKAKADKAMKNREFQIARIHAASAVREKRRQVTLRAEAARADVIINELKAAQSTRDTSRTLALASRGLESASKSVNLENLVSHANNFLARSEDFKIASSAIEDVAQGVSMQEYGAEGEADVDRLMEQLADDAGVDLRMALEADEAPREEVKDQKQADTELEDGLGARLRALRAAN